MSVNLSLIGRESELKSLTQHLEKAKEGKGSTVLLSGEAGIGKTRLLQEFKGHADEKGFFVLAGAALSDVSHPFLMVSKALESLLDIPLFSEQKFTSFSEIFAINEAGLLVAHASSSKEHMDPDIFAAMLTAIQGYVHDSIDSSGRKKGGLGRLEYGDMKILIEHGANLFLTAVFKGNEHPDMTARLRSMVSSIESQHGATLESWEGDMEEAKPVEEELASLTSARFLVRQDFEGLKLENERLRIADQVLEILVEKSSEEPLLLILEDLHWADESSLFVLNYLSRNITGSKIMIAGTLRPEMGDGLQTTMEKMSQEGSFVLMPLIQLGSGSVSSLMEAIHPGHEFPESFIDHLASACEGNPFFVIELLRQMKEEGNISTAEGKAILISQDYSIPGSVEEVVQRRLDNLDAQTMALAEYASCMGRVFESRAVMSIQTVRDPALALRELQNSGIVILDNGTAEFCHAIFQDVIYKGIGERWRSSHHKSLGEFYEEEYAGRTEEVLYDLAKHFSRSNEHEKAFDYCYGAGEKAENIFALEQAIAFYNNSLDCLSKIRSIDDCQGKKLKLLENLGDLYSLVCDFENSVKNYTSAMEKEEDMSKKADIIRRIAQEYERIGNYEKSRKECEKALGLIEGKLCTEAARLLRTLGWIYLRTGDYDKAIENIMESQRIAEALNEKKVVAQAQHALGTVYFDKGDYDTALEFYDKCLAIMKDEGDKRGEAGALNNTGLVYNLKGELDIALDHYERSLELMEKIGDKYGIAASRGNIGLLYKNKGDLEKALEFDEQGLIIMEMIGDRRGIAYSLINIGELYWLKGVFEKALECYCRSLEICLDIGDKRASVHDYHGIAESNLKLGNAQIALEYAEKGLSIAIDVGAKAEEGMIHSLLGTVYREEEAWDKAGVEFKKAKNILEKVGEKTELARLSYEQAALFKAKGEPDKARDHLEKALSMFQVMGMKFWIGKCEVALAEL